MNWFDVAKVGEEWEQDAINSLIADIKPELEDYVEATGNGVVGSEARGLGSVPMRYFNIASFPLKFLSGQETLDLSQEDLEKLFTKREIVWDYSTHFGEDNQIRQFVRDLNVKRDANTMHWMSSITGLVNQNIFKVGGKPFIKAFNPERDMKEYYEKMGINPEPLNVELKVKKQEGTQDHSLIYALNENTVENDGILRMQLWSNFILYREAMKLLKNLPE